MKIATCIPVLLIMASICFFSCKKEETTPSNNNNKAEWNWTGAAPFSVKLSNGETYTQHTTIITRINGLYQVMSYSDPTIQDTDYQHFSVAFPDSNVNGSEYSFPASRCTISYTHNSKHYLTSKTEIKIVSVSSTEIEGKFWGIANDSTGTAILDINEGYFKVKF